MYMQTFRLPWLASFFIFATSLVTPPPSFAQLSDDETEYANKLSSAFEKVAEIITPSVVNIRAVKKIGPSQSGAQINPFFEQFRQFFGDDFGGPYGSPFSQPGQGFTQEGMGTGVVISADGQILTNAHVIGSADVLTVGLNDKRTAKAKIVGIDSRTDLAVIKIELSGLKPAKIGDSDALRIGEWVIAAGNPFLFNNSITAGIVSAKGRALDHDYSKIEDYIQTDAAINPGNSGGPLVNLKGEVIGINTAIFSRSGGYMGIGFAIPSNMAKSVMNGLIKDGRVIRGWLGVSIQTLTEELAQSFNFPGTEGVLLGDIQDGSPASKADLKQGDIVISMDGNKISDVTQFRNLVAATAPGATVSLDLIRDGRKKTVSAKIGEAPKEPSKAQQEPNQVDQLGLNVADLTPQIARQLGLSKKHSEKHSENHSENHGENHGVIVVQVIPGGTAFKSGLRPNDLIISVNGNKIESAEKFENLISQSDLTKGVRLVVETEGSEHFVLLKSED